MKRWLLWVLATTVAFGFGGFLGGVLIAPEDPIVTGFTALALSLLICGGLQGQVLPSPLAGGSRPWLEAALVAMITLGALTFGVGRFAPDLGWVLGVVLAWAVLGLMQWRFLRKQVSRAGWWVGATLLGLVVAGPLVGLASWASGMPVDGLTGGLLRWVAFGFAYGGVTATALSLLLREPPGSETP